MENKLCSGSLQQKKIAEEYVEGRFDTYMSEYHKWVILTDSPVKKTWIHVNVEEWEKCEDPEDYYDDHPGCVFLCIGKWKVTFD